jgi:hypothetical protein
MPATIAAREKITVGNETFIEGVSPVSHFSVVFEDNGETGYLYACDLSRSGDYIVDAMHIYNVENVSDKHLPSEVVIAWSADGSKAGLWINEYAHAVFDFTAKRGYCRTGFPPPGDGWGDTHEWDEDAEKLLD